MENGQLENSLVHKYEQNQIKLGSKSTNNSTSAGTMTPTAVSKEDSKEEKLRKRQEQLALWRKRKEEEKQSQTVPTATERHMSSDEQEKKRLRQKRIEDWKRKRSQESSNSLKEEQKPIISVAPSIKTSINFNATKLGKGFKKQKVQRNSIISAFNDDDDLDKYKKKLKTPSLSLLGKEAKIGPGNYKTEADDEVDELDIYMENLKRRESSQPSSGSSNSEATESHEMDFIEDSQSESDDEISNEEEKQQNLLSQKLQKLSKEKEFEAIDHDSIAYDNFRKNFYIVSPEIARLSEDEVNVLRNNHGIKIRGIDCPKPITRWSQLGLTSNLMNIIQEKLMYIEPSTIQRQALPAIMAGRDIIGVAKTGSGKTLSFVLPMIRHIQDQPQLRRGDGPIGLVLTPTRELALQIYKELNHFAKPLNIPVSCCYGGSPIEGQIAQLKKGAAIIVGTPGRIIDLLTANSGRVTNLRRVTYLVLDEADRMFDMGFEPQVTKIFTQVRPDRQTVLFSATFPRKMESLARKILTNPVEIIVGGISVVASEITQKVELFDMVEDSLKLEEIKFNKLVDILDDYAITTSNAKILVFVEKQTAADDLLVRLMSKNYSSLAIHGGKDQIDRKHAIKDFSSPLSGVNILIATSIAARGLDVKGLNLVINYEAANHMEDYVHRVGRTGRAGMKGTAITFVVSNQERQITDLVKAMRASKVPEDEIPSKIIEISDKFLQKVKSGKEKFSYGFGGKGLENLQDIRDSTRDIQRMTFDGVNENPGNSDNNLPTSTNEKKSNDFTDSLPDFHIIEGRAPETSGPDKCKFHSRITINDLPQKARWIVVQYENLSKIIESTSTSITNKGQYYPPNSKIPKAIKKNGKESTPPPKLYLLVEGLTESSVREANNLIRSKMIEGLELAAKEESKAPIGKYTV